MAEVLPVPPPIRIGDGVDDHDEDEEEDDDESDSQESRSLQPYHIFPIDSMMPTMFPYFELTGASVCGHSRTTASRSILSEDTHNSATSSMLTAGNQPTSLLATPTTSDEVSILLGDLHTRMLLDELQAKEWQKHRHDVAGTLEYNERMDRLDGEMKDLIRSEKKMQRIDPENFRELLEINEKIGSLARTIGNTITASTAYEYALHMQIHVHGEDSIQVAGILCELGSLLDEKGEYTLAIERYLQALGIHQHIFGERHVLVGKTFYSIGKTAIHQGNFDQGLFFLQESLDIQKARLGADSKEVANTLYTMGCLHVKCGRVTEALVVFESSLRIQRRHRDELKIASTLKHISNIYAETGEHDLAVGCIEEWLITMGDLHSDLGREEEAVNFYREALTIRTSTFSAYDKCHGAAILKTADLYFKNGDVESARPLYFKFIQSHCDKDNTQSYLYALLLLGNCYYSKGNLDKARRCFNAAVDVVHGHTAEATDDDAPVKLLCNGRMQISSILFRLRREISSNRLEKLVKRFKWVARERGQRSITTAGARRRSIQLQTWLGQRFAKSTKT